MPGTFGGTAVTRQYATDISRISSEVAPTYARRAPWSSQVTGIIALTFTA
jgi:hypothetical protein